MSTPNLDLEAAADTPRQVSRELRDGTNSFSRNFQRRLRSGAEIPPKRRFRKLALCCHGFMVVWSRYASEILDIQRPTGFWIFITSSVIFLSVDPLFFYAFEINAEQKCLRVNYLFVAMVILVTIALSFVLHSSGDPIRNFTRNGDSILCASVIMLRLSFIILYGPAVGLRETTSMCLLMNMVFCLYLVTLIRISKLFTRATRASGIFARAQWTKALFNLLLYVHAGHVSGALWYFLAIKKEIACWKKACLSHSGCNHRYFFCHQVSEDRKFLSVSCATMTQDKTDFDFGIFHDALQSGIVETTTKFPGKLFYCLRWGLQTLSCFGQNLQPSTFAWENIFVLSICIYAVVLFASLVGNIQTYLQSETEHKRSEKMRVAGEQEEEEMRLQAQEPEQWMSFRKLSQELQEEVKKNQPYKWRESAANFNMESWIRYLPLDLGKNIKIELCLKLLNKVEEFERLSESSLKDLCNCLKPVSFIECTHIVREGDPIDEMLFVVQGKLRSYNSGDIVIDSRGSDHYSRKNSHLKDGDFYGKELATRIQADPYLSTFPNSDRSIRAITNVEAFKLMADDIQYVIVKHRAVVSIQSFWRSRRNSQESTQGRE